MNFISLSGLLIGVPVGIALWLLIIKIVAVVTGTGMLAATLIVAVALALTIMGLSHLARSSVSPPPRQSVP